MDAPNGSFDQLGASSRQFVRRLATIGENRLELLTVEVQEERERLLYAFLLLLGVATLGLLGGATLTAAIVVLLWAYSPFAVLMTLAALYGMAAVYLYRRFTELLRNWQTLPATLEQIRKDRVCLEKALA